MDKNTPVREIREKDLAANCLAFGECLKRVPANEIKTVLDIRYGRGGWARLVRNRIPNARITGYEQDRKTAKLAWADVNTDLLAEEYFPQRKVFDLLIADFNTLTQIKRQEIDDVIKVVRTKYLIFTDVCCSKLHLNYYSYGLSEPSLIKYWRRFNLDGYRFVCFARHHYAASTALYETKNPGS